MPRYTIRTLATAIVPTLMLTGGAWGEIVPPGGLSEEIATSLSERPDLGGEVEAEQSIPFSLADDTGTVFYVGQLMHDVVRNPDDNTLSFYYQFVNAPGSSILGVENLIATQFTGYQTDVAVLSDITGETAPVDALRSDDGERVTFEFDSVASRVSVGGNSLAFLVKTNATSFDDKGAADIHAFTAESIEEGSPFLAGGGASVATFRPTGAPIIAPPGPVAVPLPPAVWAGIPTMLASLIYINRVRKQSPALQGRGS